MTTIQLLICDDHPLICEGLRNYFGTNKEYEVTGTASTLAELELLLKEKTADVLILDVNLPDGSGMEFSKEIHLQYPALKIVMLTNIDDTYTVKKSFENGASGFVLKNESTSIIENAIKEVLADSVFMSGEVQKSLVNNITQAEHKRPVITRREKEVLNLLSAGYSTPEIAEKMFISTETVASHRKNLLQKFDVGKTVLMIQKAREMKII